MMLIWALYVVQLQILSALHDVVACINDFYLIFNKRHGSQEGVPYVDVSMNHRDTKMSYVNLLL